MTTQEEQLKQLDRFVKREKSLFRRQIVLIVTTSLNLPIAFFVSADILFLLIGFIIFLSFLLFINTSQYRQNRLDFLVEALKYLDKNKDASWAKDFPDMLVDSRYTLKRFMAVIEKE